MFSFIAYANLLYNTNYNVNEIIILKMNKLVFESSLLVFGVSLGVSEESLRSLWESLMWLWGIFKCL